MKRLDTVTGQCIHRGTAPEKLLSDFFVMLHNGCVIEKSPCATQKAAAELLIPHGSYPMILVRQYVPIQAYEPNSSSLPPSKIIQLLNHVNSNGGH